MPEISPENKNFYFTSFNHSADILEFLNRATHNTPIKIQNVKIGEKIVPKIFFSEVNDSENLDVMLHCLSEVLKSSINWGETGENAFKTLEELIPLGISWISPMIFRNNHHLTEIIDGEFTFKWN